FGAPATQRRDRGLVAGSYLSRRDKRNALRSFPIALFLLLSCLPLHATGRVECNSVPSKILARPVPYCIVLPASFDADKTKHFPILYFLHGLGDNEQFMVHSG